MILRAVAVSLMLFGLVFGGTNSFMVIFYEFDSTELTHYLDGLNIAWIVGITGGILISDFTSKKWTFFFRLFWATSMLIFVFMIVLMLGASSDIDPAMFGGLGP